MNRYFPVILFFVVGLLPLHAAVRSSARFAISAETTDGGGGISSSASFSLHSSNQHGSVGESSSASFVLRHGFIGADVVAALIEGRWVFYNNSTFDGDAGASANDDNAISSKTPLLPGGTADFSNYTSYSRGLNGIMIDIADLPGTPTANDFTVKKGNDNNPSGWALAQLPASVTVRAGAGANGSDRVTLIWANSNLDNTVDANEATAKQWIELTVKATANTGLTADDVFYFGNAPGETGGSGSDAYVDVSDVLGAFNNQTAGGASGLGAVRDFNRDSTVDISDVLLAFNHQTGSGTALELIDLSGGGGGALVAASVPMTLDQLADFLERVPGGGPADEERGEDILSTRSLQIRKLESGGFFIPADELQASWQLQTKDSLEISEWSFHPIAAEHTPHGFGWLIQRNPDVPNAFFRTLVPVESP